MSSGNQILLGQYGATNRTYSSSSLILHRGTYICTGPGASCVPVHPCRALTRIGSRTIGNAQFLEMQTGLPEQLQTHSQSAGPPGDGVSTPQEVPLENAQRNHSTNSEESIAVIAGSGSDNATTPKGCNTAESSSPEREREPSNAAFNIRSSGRAPKETGGAPHSAEIPARSNGTPAA